MPLTFTSQEEECSQIPTSFASVRSILPAIRITTRRAKQLQAVQVIREQREQQKQEVAFNAGPFVLCGVPLRPLPKDQLAYKCRNGKFFLQIIGHPDFALPFGQDCLIPIWVATLALRQKSRTVQIGRAHV